MLYSELSAQGNRGQDQLRVGNRLLGPRLTIACITSDDIEVWFESFDGSGVWLSPSSNVGLMQGFLVFLIIVRCSNA